MLADYSGNYHGYQHDPHEANNSGQQQRIVILWDLLKVSHFARVLIAYYSSLIDAFTKIRS